MSILTIMADERPIRRIWTDEIQHTVGREGVTKIDSYPENGHMAPLVWFAVYRGEEMFARVNGAHVVEVQYTPQPIPAPPQEDQDIPF